MDDYIVASLKRVYDDCSRALDSGTAQTAGGAIIDRYNELLDEVQAEYPHNQRIQQLEPLTRTDGGQTLETQNGPRADDLQKVKFGVTSMVDATGLDSDEFTQVADGSELPIIQITDHNAQPQSDQQYVEIDQIHSDIAQLMMPPDRKQYLKEQVTAFESELEQEHPDTDLLIESISMIEETNTKLASKMAVYALQRDIPLLDAL